ncbi:MAG: BTAD domain-containing putative transcriptional regulator [Actinomycetota bacterium]|nr:BTAD domain-containing putative transcriptional regulator [Actinomycetota bacterium]
MTWTTTPSDLGGTEPLAELSLFGSWQLRYRRAPLSVTIGAQRFLVLLALQGRQRRSYVAGTLWPEVLDTVALKRLRGVLWSLRRRCPGLIAAEDGALALSDAVWVDVHELVASATALLERNAHDPDALLAHLAVLANPGELLVGWYDEWITLERTRINELRIHALEVLVDALLFAGMRVQASRAASTAVELDPLRESTHRALMRVYLAEGNGALARRQVHRYRAILHSELGSGEPTEEMLALLAPH